MSALAAIADEVKAARDSGTSLRLTGSGTWLDAGRPVRDGATLSLAGTRGVVHYEPGDLTLTVGAGTTLDALRALTAANRQWLPLDPFGSDDGTIGATVATSSSGPLATGFGTPRDQVLGCTFVTGTGDVVTAGGRVVKNVAGFDLTRLMIGAWGTLGALTELSLRVRAVPDADVTLIVPLEGAGSVQHAWRWLRQSDYRPMAAELLSPALSEMLALSRVATLAVRLGGSSALVAAAQGSLASVGTVTETSSDAWQALRRAEPAGAHVLRLSTRPSRIAALWESVSGFGEGDGWSHASLARGVIRCVVPAGPDAPARVTRLLALRAPDVSCIVERASDDTWRRIPSPVSNDLSRRVRDTFDPSRVLNRGILGEAS